MSGYLKELKKKQKELDRINKLNIAKPRYYEKFKEQMDAIMVTLSLTNDYQFEKYSNEICISEKEEESSITSWGSYGVVTGPLGGYVGHLVGSGKTSRYVQFSSFFNRRAIKITREKKNEVSIATNFHVSEATKKFISNYNVFKNSFKFENRTINFRVIVKDMEKMIDCGVFGRVIMMLIEDLENGKKEDAI